MRSVTIPGVVNTPNGPAAGGSVTAVPNFLAQQTVANLASGASINFDFTGADNYPIFDMYVFADQSLDVLIYIRQSSTDTYRLLDSDVAGGIFASGVANALKRVLNGQRFPGSQVRIQLKNNQVGATTVLSAQVRASSL